MLDDARLATTQIRMRIDLAPLEHVAGDLGGIVSRHSVDLVSAFYPRRVAKKANVVLTELIGNVLENFTLSDSAIRVELELGDHHMRVEVANTATPEQHAVVREHLERIVNSDSPHALFARTIRERHRARLEGGLGLMRLVAENKFTVTVGYTEDSMMTVTAEIDLGEIS